MRTYNDSMLPILKKSQVVRNKENNGYTKTKAKMKELQVQPRSASFDKNRSTIANAVEAFGSKLVAEGRSVHTISAYVFDLTSFVDVLENRHPGISLTDVTYAFIDEVLMSPDVIQSSWGNTRSPASINRFKAAIRSFFKWAEQIGRIHENPARNIKLHRLPPRLPRFLTDAERIRLHKELRGSKSKLGFRDRVIIELFLGTGIRRQELVDLDIDSVDFDSKQLRIHRTKGGGAQVKFLNTSLCVLLRQYLIERHRFGSDDKRALFLSIRGKRLCPWQVGNRLRHWLKVAGIEKKLSPHSLRHTFATHLYSQTRDILMVQRALGHRDISTTMVYTHLLDSSLEEALERL